MADQRRDESTPVKADRALLQPVIDGSGPLLERDYWAVIEDAELDPEGVAELVATRFPEFSPTSLVRFYRRKGNGELHEGDELDVKIVGAGTFGVRIIHRGPQSITIGTLHGHPEAGRITFGAYRHQRGDVIFHIRSRARSGSRSKFLGFLFAGDPMQTNCWTDFINQVAATVGSGVQGAVHAEKRRAEEEPGDRSMDGPTFVAEGG